jgi:3',5'-cyclic AMP phosphodiesterase CpdA
MFTLAHLSDPHLGPLPRPRLRELATRRAIGFINWHRKRARGHRPRVLGQLVDAVRAESPDHIAVTGDIINIALPEEIRLARHWLDSIGPPSDVTVIPGNHDAYVPGAARAARESWKPFMTGDEESHLHYPFIRRRGHVALVGTSTARATAPLIATGHMNNRQLAELRLMLEGLRAEGLFRVVLIHHPPVAGSTPLHRRFIGAERFRRVIREAGAELIIHGHNHTRTVYEIAGKEGSVPVVGVPSASNTPGSRRYPAAGFNLYRIGGRPGAFTCSMTEFGIVEPGEPPRKLREQRLIG